MANVLPIFFVIAAGLCLALVLLAIWQSLRGLLVRGSGAAAGHAPGDRGRERLLHEKQELLTAIRDVRLERDLGKVSGDDFERLEQNYRSHAREVLRELEEQIAPHRAAAQQLLDQALGVRGATQVEASGPTGAGRVASDTKAEAASRGAGHSCPRCKTGNDVDAVFCKKCGERLLAKERT